MALMLLMDGEEPVSPTTQGMIDEAVKTALKSVDSGNSWKLGLLSMAAMLVASGFLIWTFFKTMRKDIEDLKANVNNLQIGAVNMVKESTAAVTTTNSILKNVSDGQADLADAVKELRLEIVAKVLKS